MTSLRSLSFEELLCRLPEEKRYLLDFRVENDRHLAEIAKKVTRWRPVLPYLMAGESEETEEAIRETYQITEDRRLVSSEVIKPVRMDSCFSNCTKRL